MPRELVRSTHAADLDACRALLAAGSKSFATAAKLLPACVRDAATVFYAFCRVADDAVDLGDDPAAALTELQVRLARIYAGVPLDHPVDRAMAQLVVLHRLPRTVVDALIEGLAWDVEERSYDTYEDLLDYCMRVASAVGVAMSVLMGVRDPVALARACDLGAAMQLTNIARDVGEDARNGRIYLPRAWLREVGIDAARLLAHPVASDALSTVVARLLERAEALYRRGEAGIALLPSDCRASIRAAARIYADIGRVIARNGHDSVTRRAVVSMPRKLWLALVSWVAPIPRDDERLARRALPQARFLIEAVDPA